MLKNITYLISYRFSPFQWTSAIRQGFATPGGVENDVRDEIPYKLIYKPDGA